MSEEHPTQTVDIHAVVTTKFAIRILMLFSLVGLLHVPAFYLLLWIETARQSPPVLEACPTVPAKPIK